MTCVMLPADGVASSAGLSAEQLIEALDRQHAALLRDLTPWQSVDRWAESLVPPLAERLAQRVPALSPLTSSQTALAMQSPRSLECLAGYLVEQMAKHLGPQQQSAAPPADGIPLHMQSVTSAKLQDYGDMSERSSREAESVESPGSALALRSRTIRSRAASRDKCLSSCISSR